MKDWFHEHIVEPGRAPLFACFAAFIVTFLSTRGITRLIRAGKGPFKDNVSGGGLHIHHAVPGLILLVAGAFTAITVADDSAWMVLAGILVGIGTSLVLDEFALILHLEDVYWAEEGRVSVEMVSLAFCCLGLALLGLNPLGLSDEDGGLDPTGVAATVATIAVHLVIVVVCVAKGRYTLALIGAFVPFVAMYGAVRLARPGSRWARKRYGPERLAKATAREASRRRRLDPLADRMADLVAGAPSEPDPPPT